ncbi:MAG: restriction endonuclease subunit S [bacterium]
MSKHYLKPGWRIVKFGDIAQNVAIRVDPSEAKTDIYVGLEHLDPETLHLRHWGHPSDVTGQKLAFKKGDVIFGRRRAYQRKLAVAEFDGICSAHAMVIRAKPKMILPEFLLFFLQSDMFMERAIAISVGSLSPTINWTTLCIQEFPLPPIEEQKRIAEILWAADEVIEEWSKSIMNLETIVTQIAFAYFKYSGYEVQTLRSQVSESAYGPRFSSSKYSNSGALGQIRTTDISEDGTINYSTVPLANLDVEDYKFHILRTDDLLISRSGTCGVACVFKKQSLPMLPGAFLIRFRLKESLNSEFAKEYFNSQVGRAHTAKLSQGGVQNNLRGSTLLQQFLPVPPIQTQMTVVDTFCLLRKELKLLWEHRFRSVGLAKHLCNEMISPMMELSNV